MVNNERNNFFSLYVKTRIPYFIHHMSKFLTLLDGLTTTSP
jgi:hypothetical protein